MTKVSPVQAVPPVSANVVTSASEGQDVTDSPVSDLPMKKIELIDKVVETSGIKKKFAKPVVEAALAVLGEALREGRSLNLHPMGKVMPRNSKDLDNGRVINARIRQSLINKKED